MKEDILINVTPQAVRCKRAAAPLHIPQLQYWLAAGRHFQ